MRHQSPYGTLEPVENIQLQKITPRMQKEKLLKQKQGQLDEAFKNNQRCLSKLEKLEKEIAALKMMPEGETRNQIARRISTEHQQINLALSKLLPLVKQLKSDIKQLESELANEQSSYQNGY